MPGDTSVRGERQGRNLAFWLRTSSQADEQWSDRSSPARSRFWSCFFPVSQSKRDTRRAEHGGARSVAVSLVNRFQVRRITSPYHTAASSTADGDSYSELPALPLTRLCIWHSVFFARHSVQRPHAVAKGVPVMLDQRVRDRLQISSQDLIQFVQRQVDPVVGNTIFGEIVSPNSLAAIA